MKDPASNGRIFLFRTASIIRVGQAVAWPGCQSIFLQSKKGFTFASLPQYVLQIKVFKCA